MRVGVLALQGDYAEHADMLEGIGVEVVEVRLPDQLGGLSGLVIPGGESTTIGKLAGAYGLIQPLRSFAAGHAVWGTCAGAILLSRDVHRKQPLLGLMDITIERNAFGRQVSSFEVDLDVPVLAHVDRSTDCRVEGTGDGRTLQPYHAVFIRAPLIESVGDGVQVLAALTDGRIVAAQQGHWLATSFHPELTNDDRFHRYFLALCDRPGSAEAEN
jgi:5'-phosphate synthase pdxT subunit